VVSILPNCGSCQSPGQLHAAQAGWPRQVPDSPDWVGSHFDLWRLVGTPAASLNSR
jgi:hypothetical protein